MLAARAASMCRFTNTQSVCLNIVVSCSTITAAYKFKKVSLEKFLLASHHTSILSSQDEKMDVWCDAKRQDTVEGTCIDVSLTV